MIVAPIRIDTAEDPRIAGFRAVRERDLRRRDDLFVAEGKVVVDVLLRARRFAPVAGLVLDRRLDSVRAGWPAEVPLYVADQAVLDAIAGFHLHRGILALARRREAEPVDQLLAGLPERALVAVAIGLSNHDNVGALLRNAAAFDADAVLLDATCSDPLYRKAIRVSVGAALQVPFAQGGSADELLASLDRAGFTTFALSPGAAATLAECPRPARLALLFGAEGPGLPPALLHRLPSVRIAMSSRFDSLNVAAAAAIALHHFRN